MEELMEIPKELFNLLLALEDTTWIASNETGSTYALGCSTDMATWYIFDQVGTGFYITILYN